MTNITKSIKNKPIISATLTTRDDVVEYCITRGHLRRDQWKGYHPDTASAIDKFLEIDSVAQTSADLLLRFDVLNPTKKAKANSLAHYVRRGWDPVEAQRDIATQQRSHNSFKQAALTPEHWIACGETPERALELADDKRYGSTARRPEYWMKKGFTYEEALAAVSNQQAKQSYRSTKYWTTQGLSDEEAQQKVSESQSNHAQVYAQQWRDGKGDRSTRVRTLEYWLVKTSGDVPAAKKALRDWQRTFSLELCIEKYGIEVGTSKWQTRQDKWQTTMNSKPLDEQVRIKSAKHIPGNATPYGKLSQKLFWAIYADISELDIRVYFATLDHTTGMIAENVVRNYEYCIQTPLTVYRPDFFVPELNLVIEFDEKYHWTGTAQQDSDATRQAAIIKALEPSGPVHFFRVRETEFTDDEKATSDKLVAQIFKIYDANLS
jgi:very-short-patch-repair endonuclease